MTPRHTDDACIGRHHRDPARPRRALDGLYICHGHLEQLLDNLAALPGLYDALAEQLATSGTGGQRVSGSPSTPLPINLGVAEHRGTIQAVLASWCRLVVDDRGITEPASSEVVVTAPWLSVHAQWAAGHQWVDELLEEIRGITIRARRLLDPDRRLATGERCRMTLDETGRCSGVVTMVQGADETWTARCDACGPQEAAPYLHGRVAGRWVTVERVVAYALRVHGRAVGPAAVRQWAHRERIASQEDGGRVWYELGSVERYLSARKARQQQAEGERIAG